MIRSGCNIISLGATLVSLTILPTMTYILLAYRVSSRLFEVPRNFLFVIIVFIVFFYKILFLSHIIDGNWRDWVSVMKHFKLVLDAPTNICNHKPHISNYFFNKSCAIFVLNPKSVSSDVGSKFPRIRLGCRIFYFVTGLTFFMGNWW